MAIPATATTLLTKPTLASALLAAQTTPLADNAGPASSFTWHWPWALAIGAGAALVVAIIWLLASHRAQHNPAQAEVYDLDADFGTEYTSRLLQLWRRLNKLAVATLAIALALAVTLTARPSQVGQDEEHTSSRDIVLCLDVSPSMLAYDHDVLGSYQRLISNFKGERIGLSIFNSTSRTLFPLTDDYNMASSQLKYATDVLGKVSNQDKIDKMDAKTSQNFSDLIEGTQNRKDMTSLIGDGLVSCAAMLPGFTYGAGNQDNANTKADSSTTSTSPQQSTTGSARQRPKSIVLATDNVSGTSTYSLEEALNMTTKAKISVDGLYSGAPSSKNDKTTLEMKQQIQAHGGTFSSDGNDPDSINSIVQSIEKRKAKTLEQVRKASMLDKPGWWTLALAIATLAWLALARKLRR